MANKVSVVIGRFQPFHKGHQHLIQRALAGLGVNDVLFILVGNADEPATPKNPWSWTKRKQWIADWLSGQWQMDHLPQVHILPLRDYESDLEWASGVQEAVSGYTESKITLFGHDKDASTYYLKMFPQWDYVDVPNLDIAVDATGIREMIFTDRFAFLYGVVDQKTLEDIKSDDLTQVKEEYKMLVEYKKSWAHSPYPPTFVTADAIVVQSGHVLLVCRGRSPGFKQWAIPGGFVDVNERIEDAVFRELFEETNIKVPEKVLRHSVVASRVFDRPDRSLRGRTITHAYLMKLDDTLDLPKVRAGDDAWLARWIPFSEVKNMRSQMFEDHYTIIMSMIGKL